MYNIQIAKIECGRCYVKAVLVSGSPRKNGNTVTILNEIGRGLQNQGFEIKYFILHECTIHLCVGCKTCYKTGDCVHDDDVALIMQEVFDAQLAVIASPSYWGDVTAQLKLSLIDARHTATLIQKKS